MRSPPSDIPSSIGIYFFKKGSKILYIGKSVNIKTRILSHFKNADIDSKEAKIIQESDNISYQLTDTEFNALILESHLIQEYQPKYNAIWRDDKSYLYIKITIQDLYPKLLFVRKEDDEKSFYFGPFTSMQIIQEIMREIRKLFPYCSQKKIGKKPCFYSKIALCNPCPNQIEKITDIRLKERLKNNYRKNIIQIIRVLNGDVNLVLRDLYRKLKKLSRQKDSYEEALVLRNQINRFESSIHNSLSDYEKKPSDPKYAIKQLLHLLNPFFPNFQKLRRIECYDISDLSKEFTAASMVVMTDGIIDKSEYKRFKIKNLQAKSDFEMLEEVLRRRFNNQFPKPDLIVVDGGKPQVRTVYKILIDLSNSIPVIGIAKHPDRLIVGTNIFPMIRPSLHNEGFNLVRIIRDESHRFAKKYHLHLRNVKLNPTLNKLL